MKETEFYGRLANMENRFNQVVQFVENMQQSIRLAFTGQEIRGASLQSLLLKKGLITEAELTEEIGKTIQKMQADAEEAAKKVNIVQPTAEQVQQVTATPADATPAVVAEVPATPPQA
jgi:uncharacterized iron-regulated protein